MSSAKKGFLLRDALIGMLILAYSLALADTALYVHVRSTETRRNVIEETEEGHTRFLEEMKGCGACAEEEDP